VAYCMTAGCVRCFTNNSVRRWSCVRLKENVKGLRSANRGETEVMGMAGFST
jgi:hypothetical protein